MKTWFRNNRTEVYILMLLSLMVNAINYLQIKGWCISFFDPDDYMRLVRMEEFFSGGSFYEQVIHRANSPFGGVMHWSRFYDLLWILPVHFASFFMDSVKESVEII